MRLTCVLFFVFAASLSWAQAPKSPVLFTVNKQPVTQEEFAYVYKKNNQGKPENFTEEKIQEYLELFINFKLKVAEARQQGIDTSAAFRKEFQTYREELKKPFQATQDELDRLTKEAYQRLTEEVNASHILVAIPESNDTTAAYQKIMEIRKRVMAGEDFAKLAGELSEDPSAKSNGGNLGYFTAMQMVYPFESAAYNLKKGEVSNPVRSRFGYHLVKLIDRRPASGEVEIAHILLRAEPKDAAKAKDKIFQIYDQLKAGRSWDEVCKEYSDDASTKNSGGKLRRFGVGAFTATAPEFEATAFSLQQPGEISDPFQSVYGWHIVKLEKKIPLPAFAELEASLKRRVSREERLQISKAAVLTRRKKEYGFNETDLKSKLTQLADTTLVKGKWKFAGPSVYRTQTLFTLAGTPVTGNEFIIFTEQNQSQSGMEPAAYMNQLYDKFTEEKISALEEKKLMEENADFRNLLTEYREGILFFTVMEKRVWNKASEDTVGQRKYYEEHRAKYTAGDRVEARVFATPDKSFFDKMNQKIKAGDSLTRADLKQFKSVSNFRNYEKGESKAVDKVSWSVGLHETEDNGMYYLVEINNLVLPGVKTFSEARASVISDYQEKLEKDWIAELKKKYTVEVNKKVKKSVFTELKKNAIKS